MILWPVALIYRLAVFVRNMMFDLGILKAHAFKLPVISVGNITAGGTGKTPHVEYLAALLQDHCRIAILSRGYKRKTRGFLTVSVKSAAVDVGDESLQIKRKFPDIKVAVDRRRVAGIRRLIKMKPGPDVIILDDAFQHRYVKPGLSILLVDYNRPIFRDIILPAGNLREPWRNAIRADIIIVSKCPANLDFIEKARIISRLKIRSEQHIFFTTIAYGKPLPVFTKKHSSRRSPDLKSLDHSEAGIILVTGVADPAPLRQFLSGFVEICDEITYPDHHSFGYRDLALIAARYRQIIRKEKYIFVTEKDAVRLRKIILRDKELQKAFYYIPIKVKFLAKDEKPFIRRISKFLKKSRKAISLRTK